MTALYQIVTVVCWGDMGDTVLSIYRNSRKRLFLLDYDGVLRELQLTPDQAVPTSEIKQLLGDLARDAANTVVIVSGRGHETLEQWLGDLPVSLVAEHGMMCRTTGSGWQSAPTQPSDWQAPVRELMDKSVDAVPGSLIETKLNSLVWHYRAAEQVAAAAERITLLDALSPLAERYKLRLLASEKSMAVDVQPQGSDKGSSVRHWFNLNEYDFILAAGDDQTDEDLFRALPSHAVSFKIGEGETVATDRLPDPAAVRKLLADLVR